VRALAKRKSGGAGIARPVRRALSGSARVGQGGWIDAAGAAIATGMIRYAARLAFAPLLVALATATATADASDLSVLPAGRYACWTAGIASGPAVTDRPERAFTIVRGSRYEAESGGGTYLLAGDLLTFTRGPFKDQRLRRNRDGFWQEVTRSGAFGPLRCSRAGIAPPGADTPAASGAPAGDRD
jgi:hypothetical protein